MRLIDADKLIEYIDAGKYCNPNVLTFSENDVCEMIKHQPTVIGECKDCREADFIYQGADSCYCLAHSTMMNADDWCSSFKSEVE